MAKIRMPDGTLVEAPDQPTAQQVEQLRLLSQKQVTAKQEAANLAAASNFGKPSVGSEVLKAGDVAVRGGVLGLPGLAGDAFIKLADWVAKNPLVANSSLPAKAISQIGRSDRKPEEMPSALLYRGTGGPLSEPETSEGRIAGNIGAATIGGVAGGGPLKAITRAGIGASSGVGSEVGGAVTDDSMAGRLAGGLAGGGFAGLMSILRPNADSLVRNSTKAVTDADWKRAEMSQAVLNRNEIPHLNSQLLGPNSSLDDVVNQASMDPTVRPQLQEATRNIIPKTEGAVRAWSDENLPVFIGERRGMLADVQGQAQQARTSLTNGANAAYEEAMPDLAALYEPKYVEGLRKELTDLAKSDRYGPESAGGKALLAFADGKLPRTGPVGLPKLQPFARDGASKYREELEALVRKEVPAEDYYDMLDEMSSMSNKDLIEVIQSSAGKMPIAHLNNLLKDLNTISLQDGFKGLPVNDLKVILRKYTPEFDSARQARTEYISANREPFDQGLAGTIRRAGGGPDDEKYTAVQDTVKLVFPPNKAQPAAITRLASDIGAEPVGWLLRDHLEQSLQAATKSMKTNNPTAPADFVHAIAGNSAQRSNIEAALFTVAKEHKVNPFAVRNGFYQLLTALNTFRDAKISPSISGSTTQFRAGTSAAGAAVAPQSRIARYFWEQASTKTYQQIADLVTSADGLKKIEAIAKSPTPQARQALIASMLTQEAVTRPPLRSGNMAGETPNAP